MRKLLSKLRHGYTSFRFARFLSVSYRYFGYFGKSKSRQMNGWSNFWHTCTEGWISLSLFANIIPQILKITLSHGIVDYYS